MFWSNLTPDGDQRPEGELAAAIDDQFGSFERFRRHLSAATVSVQGVGERFVAASSAPVVL